jgi:hypothetical protein
MSTLSYGQDFFVRFEEGDANAKRSHPTFDCDRINKNVIFDWYVVADAICGAFDYMMHTNASGKWDPRKPTSSHDYDLLLCAI